MEQNAQLDNFVHKYKKFMPLIKHANMAFSLLVIMLFVIEVFRYKIFTGLMYLFYAIENLVFHLVSHEKQMGFLRSKGCFVDIVFIVIVLWILVNIVLLATLNFYKEQGALAISIVTIIFVMIQGASFTLYCYFLSCLHSSELNFYSDFQIQPIPDLTSTISNDSRQQLI